MAKVISSRARGRNIGKLSLIGLAAVAALLAILITVLPAQAAPIETVSNTLDSGAGSLRDAIANVDPNGEIVFTVTGTITLTTGQLLIDKELTITGPGSANLTISGNGTSRIFEIRSQGVEISGVTITGGSAVDGGGILVSNWDPGDGSQIGSQLNLDDVTVFFNTATNNGGGILVRGGGAEQRFSAK